MPAHLLAETLQLAALQYRRGQGVLFTHTIALRGEEGGRNEEGMLHNGDRYRWVLQIGMEVCSLRAGQ